MALATMHALPESMSRPLGVHSYTTLPSINRPDLGQNLSSPSTQCNSNSTFGVGGVSESDGEVRVLRIGVVEKKGITGSLPNLKSK